MADLFEAHITFDKQYAEQVKSATVPGWKFSQIDSDPILGPGSKCYLTHYDKNDSKLLESMTKVANSLNVSGIPHLRLKVERIIYDTATGIDQIASRG